MSLPSIPIPELLRLCAESDDPAVWEEFIRRFHPLIALTALRVCRQWREYSAQAADDLVQEVYVKLCANGRCLLREFQSEYPDSFCGYLKTLTGNHVHDHFKAMYSAKRGSGRGEDSLDAAGAVAEDRRAHTEQKVLLREIEACLEQVSPGTDGKRDRLIFRLYYRHGLTAQQIASVPEIGLTTKGVESVILRLIRQLQLALLAKRGTPGPEGMPGAESL